MSLRRLDRTTAFLGISLFLVLGNSAEGQLSDGQWRLMQANTGRTAIEVRPQPTVVFAPGGLQSSLFRHPVQVSFVPTVTMSDGTVFANFGRGFEPVQRSSCGSVAVVGQPRVIGSNGVVLREAAPPTYTQAVPSQLTSSYLMLPSVQAQSAKGRGALRGGGHDLPAECFSQDAPRRAVGYRR